MITSLLTTRFLIPTLPGEWITRPRLLLKMDDIFQPGKKLLLISAPAGYGKTSLLSEWSQNARLNGQKIAWLSLDSADTDPARFVLYCIYAIQKALPGVGEAEMAALQSPQPPALESVLVNLINQAAGLPDGLTLVLDDYHLLKTTAIYEAVAFLLDHMPAQMRLAIATRTDPALPLARLRARKQLVELRAADLRFLSSEASAFFNQTGGLALAEDQVGLLEARTEGWAAGLQLAALSLQGRKDIPEFIQTFSGSHVYVLDYLTEEVLNQQTEAVRDFLLQTCVLERLSDPLCGAVTLRDDSQSMLVELCRANLFLIPLDDQQHWFRYHHLFADLLRAQLERLYPGRAQELHRRASRWFAEHDFPSEAIRHALAGGDPHTAAGLVQQHGMDLLMQGAMITLTGWLNSLPADLLRSRPWLVLYRAWIQLLSGYLAEAGEQLKILETRLEADPQEDADPQKDLDHLRGHMAAIRAYIASYQGNMAAALEQAHQAIDLLPGSDNPARCVAYYTMGTAAFLGDDLPAACEALSAASRTGRSSGNLHMAVPAACTLGIAQMMMGKLGQAEVTFRSAQEMSTSPAGTPTPLFGNVCAVLSDLTYERGDLEGSERCAVQGIQLCRQLGNPEGLAKNHMALGRALLARGAYAEAEQAMESAVKLIQEHTVSQALSAFIHSWRIRLWLARPDSGLTKAVSWLEQKRLGPQEAIRSTNELERLAEARVLVAVDRLDDALLLLDQLFQQAEQGQRVGRALLFLAAQAAALYLQGKTGLAITALERALSIGQPEGYIRSFVDEGEPMRHLLLKCRPRFADRPSAAVYIQQLLDAFPEPVSPEQPSSPTAAPHPGLQPDLLVEPLSDRELEVLRLIAEGCSNTEISTRLYIALSTTKRHINHILDKLDAANRTHAIAKARELGLL